MGGGGRELLLSLRGSAQIFVFALFRTEIKRFLSVIEPYRQAGIHVHSAYRIFHHAVWNIFDFFFCVRLFGDADETAKETPQKP